MINKYYDLALAGDEMAKGHYEKLSVKAARAFSAVTVKSAVRSM